MIKRHFEREHLKIFLFRFAEYNVCLIFFSVVHFLPSRTRNNIEHLTIAMRVGLVSSHTISSYTYSFVKTRYNF